MSKDLIKTIQGKTDMRLILPFGLSLRPGDIVSVGRDGGFSLEGSTESLLGLSVRTRDAGSPTDIYRLSGHETTCTFRGVGEASTLFPELPSASARFDVSFSSEQGWLLAMTGRQLRPLEEFNQLRRPILLAYRRGVWKPDWAIVTGVATADRMTLLAAETQHTDVMLTLSAIVTTGTPVEARLTAGVSITATSQQLTQCITQTSMPVACTGRRVRDPWWRNPYVQDLGDVDLPKDAEAAPDDQFWEDVDDL